MSDLTYEYPAEVVMQRARETRALVDENARLRAALEEIAEGCGHARCHAYRFFRLADKALRG
jgi:hypothetical protein